MRPNIEYYINRWFWMGVDLLYPPSCVGCEKLGVVLCPSCLAKIKKISPPFCICCGAKITNGNICSNCEVMPLKISAIRSWAYYDDITRKALHQLKYRRNLALGETFSHFLSELIKNTDWKIDVITPIPLGRGRYRERGYNQAALLAKPVANKLNIPYRPKIVHRWRETRSQVDLTLSERKNNVAGAFKANRDLALGKRVLIIDDITTSGSTLISCAESLIDAGAKAVYGVTVARAG